jgi:hypothetical protein
MSAMRYSVLSLLALAACDSQVDSEHQGEPLATIAGSVTSIRAAPPADSEVVVLWVNSSGSPDLEGGDSVEVDGSFPAQFQLSMYEPPEDRLLNNFEGVKLGVAYIIAGVPGTDYSDDNAVETSLLGMEVDHFLVYVPEAVPAGSHAAFFLRDTPAAGFHLYRVHQLDEAEQEARRACIDALPDPTTEAVYTQCGGTTFDDLSPEPDDLATPLDIQIVNDISEIDIPEWT